jgi:hypothetical protein
MALSPVVAGFFAFWLFAIVFLGLLATLVGTL